VQGTCENGIGTENVRNKNGVYAWAGSDEDMFTEFTEFTDASMPSQTMLA